MAPLKRAHYARRLQRYRPEQEPEYPVLCHLVSTGMTVVDIGANVGFFTKVLSVLAGPDGSVTAIEAVPYTYRILVHELNRMGLRNVTTLHCAVSDGKGEVRMFIPHYADGGNNFYAARVSAQADDREGQSVTVEALRLDDLFPAGSPAIGFVKCDVEWHELACLRGGLELIRRDHPAWMVEILGDPDQSGSNAEAVFELMEAEGYQAWWYDPAGRLEPLAPRQRRGPKMLAAARAGTWENNYYFLMPAHLQDLRSRAPGLFRH